MNLYETVFILKPDLSEEENQQWIQRVIQVVEQNNGEIIRLDHWGVTKLAYDIKKFEKGYFVYAVFKGPYACIQEMDRHFKMLDPFLRHLIIKLDEKELEKHLKAEMVKKAAVPESPPSEQIAESENQKEAEEKGNTEKPEEVVAPESETTAEKAVEEVTA